MPEKKQIEHFLKKWGKEYKKGFISYFIMLFLKERPMYGFEIIKKLQEITSSQIFFQESGIYQVLKRLDKHTLVTATWKKSDIGPRRKYYELNQKGLEMLEMFTVDYIFPILTLSNNLIELHFPGLKQPPAN